MTITDEQFYKTFEEYFRTLTTSGKAPWMHEGVSEREVAYNPKSGVVFKGVNSVMLEMSAASNGFKESRWLSGEEVEKLGFQPRHGQKPTPIAYINKYVHPTDVHPSTGIPFDRDNPKEKYYFMYNIEQLKEYEKLKAKTVSLSKIIAEEKIKNAIQNVKSNNFQKILETLNKSVASAVPEHGEIIGASMAQYRIAQDFNMNFKPTISNDLLKQSLNELKPEAIIRTMYAAEVTKEQLISKDRILEHGMKRTVERTRAQGMER
jgi:hypothetical protein